jgi:hypothetical protein
VPGLKVRHRCGRTTSVRRLAAHLRRDFAHTCAGSAYNLPTCSPPVCSLGWAVRSVCVRRGRRGTCADVAVRDLRISRRKR